MMFKFMTFLVFLSVSILNAGSLIEYKKTKDYIYFLQDGEKVYVNKDYEVSLKKKPFTIVFPFSYDSSKKESFQWLAQVNFSDKAYAYEAIKNKIPTQNLAAFFTLTNYEIQNKNEEKAVNISDNSNIYLSVDMKQNFDSFNEITENNATKSKGSLKNYLGYFEVEKMSKDTADKWAKAIYITYAVSGELGYEVADNFFSNAKAESTNEKWDEYYKHIENVGYTKSFSLEKKVIIPIKVNFY